MYRKNEILARIELRQSTIKDWLNCPLMYRFRHVERLRPAHRSIAAIHGSALHLAIHLLHEGGFEQDVDHLYQRAFKAALEQDSDIPIRWKKSEAEDMETLGLHASELLKGYRDFEENSRCQLLYSELQFRVRIGGHLLTGTMDQVRVNSSGELDLVDLKSGMQRPHAKSLSQDWQLSLYAYALKFGELAIDGKWVRPRLSVDRTLIYFLRAHERYKRNTKYGSKGEEKGQPFIVCQKPAWDLLRFRQDLLNLLKMMTKDWPFPNPNACGFCAFQSPCADRTLYYGSSRVRKLKTYLVELELYETKRKSIL